MDKKALRAEIRAKKRALTEEQIVRYSEELAQKLFAHPLYQAAKSIYGYMSYNQEVRTMPILRRAQADGKRVAVPKVYGDEMKFLWLDDLNRTVSGAYSIPEPVGDEPEASMTSISRRIRSIRRSRCATASRCTSIWTWTNLTSRWTR